MRSHIWMFCSLAACQAAVEEVDPCADPSTAPATCLSPTLSPEEYAARSSAYFDTMDKRANLEDGPAYGETIVRWEWPPWLLLTAFGRENIEAADTLLRLYPSIVEERDCRAFDTQPFGRCRVVFYYDDHDGKPCPIYEEFTFNDAGEVTFIEAWSDLPGYLPMAEDDTWAEGDNVDRLSTRIPGLGGGDGSIDVNSDAMQAAGKDDPVIADLIHRGNNFLDTWSAAWAAAGDEMWTEGCGW